MSVIGPGDGASGFVHQAAIYGSDEEFLATVGSFLREGVEAGEPTLVGMCEREMQLLREALADVDGLTFLPADGYRSPLLTLKEKHELLARSARAGAARLAGQISEQQLDANWDAWIRYEAAVGHVLAALPVQALCAYDSRRAPAAVLDDVVLSHRLLATAGGRPSHNLLAVDPAALLTERMRGVPDPLEQSAPAVELSEPSVGAARDAVAGCARGTGLDEDEVHGLTLAVSEVVTNAYRHGRPDVTMCAWAGPDRVVVTVTDTGAGPVSPFVGLAPATGAARTSGFGLWITQLVCSRVDHVRSADGFTVRLTMLAR